MIKAWPLPAYASNLQNLISENGKDGEETIPACDKCPRHQLASKSSICSHFEGVKGKKDGEMNERSFLKYRTPSLAYPAPQPLFTCRNTWRSSQQLCTAPLKQLGHPSPPYARSPLGVSGFRPTTRLCWISGLIHGGDPLCLQSLSRNSSVKRRRTI